MTNVSAESKVVPSSRPELELNPQYVGEIGDVEKSLSFAERAFSVVVVRRVGILVLLAALWEIAAVTINNPLMMPTFTATTKAFFGALMQGTLLNMVWLSVSTLLKGYIIGTLLAGILACLAVWSRLGNDLLATLTSMFNPLPSIALLPMALLWFGLGEASIVFVLVHAVLWPLALNTLAGFTSISPTLLMCGRNYGLRGLSFIWKILIPAAFPSILTGLKIGWAFAWRTLIAAEMVFGISTGNGGLGWYIFISKNELLIANVFAGLMTVIIIGLLVENAVFGLVEKHTVRKWGMVR